MGGDGAARPRYHPAVEHTHCLDTAIIGVDSSSVLHAPSGWHPTFTLIDLLTNAMQAAG